jgi:class 3 adenylate cyclase
LTGSAAHRAVRPGKLGRDGRECPDLLGLGGSVLAKLTGVLHRNPVTSTVLLLACGMALVLTSMINLSRQTSRQLAEQFVSTYVMSLDGFQAAYSESVVSRLRGSGVEITHDYHDRKLAVPLPATFSIELAERLTDPDSGLVTRVYSDYPFRPRTDGGPRDDYEREALVVFRAAADPQQPYIRYARVNGRESLRYSSAMLMAENCVACHNSHPQSTRTDWKVGDVRGVRSVVYPLDSLADSVRSGWLMTVAVMVAIILFGSVLVFVIVQALRQSIGMLSVTNSAYARFVPRAFLAYLSKDSIVDVDLNDNVEREMTVLFSDIRSFTELSERMTPEQNFRFVNEYLRAMGPVVRRHGGFIDKYIGDAIMALFDRPDDAVIAALDMLDELKVYNADRVAGGEDAIRIGIGLHTGRLRLGTIGEADRMDGTVIGDSVNLAARLEGLTKFYRVQCLMSRDTLSGVEDAGTFQHRRMDKVTVKGKVQPVDIYEVMGAGETRLRGRKLDAQDQFQEAIDLFQAGDFKSARKLFASVSADLPEDRATALYVERCDEYLRRPPDAGWDGSLRLDSK